MLWCSSCLSSSPCPHLQVGPPVVEGVVVSTKGHYGFAEIDAEGAAKLGLGEHTRMFFHMSQVQSDYRLSKCWAWLSVMHI